QGHPKTQFGWRESEKAAYPPGDPVPIRFEWNDRETLMHLGDHAAHWPNYLRELVRELPMHYLSWRQVPTERKVGVMARIGMESSATREPVADPDLLLDTHCSNIEMGVPYTEEEIMAIVQKGKQGGHLLGVSRVLSGSGTNVLSPPPPRCAHPADVKKLKRSNKRLTKQVSMILKLFRSDDKMLQMLTQLELLPEFGSGSGSGGCGDDEPGNDEDGGENEEHKEDTDN
ncbi:hypothetical protein Tco_0083599, partial [Tanacetum coccineum]